MKTLTINPQRWSINTRGASDFQTTRRATRHSSSFCPRLLDGVGLVVEDGVGQDFPLLFLFLRLFGVRLASHLVQERHRRGLWSLFATTRKQTPRERKKNMHSDGRTLTLVQEGTYYSTEGEWSKRVVGI